MSYFEPQEPPKEAEKQVLDKLISIHEKGVKVFRPYAFGILGPATIKSTLKVTRPDCEFIGELGQHNEDILQSWLQNAVISGHTSVRNAREIGVNEFTVEPKLFDEIAEIWKKKFIPNGRQLNGYDAVMLSAARQIEETTVGVVPVVTRLLRRESDSELPAFSLESKPFTQAQVDLQLGRECGEVKKECAWFEWFKDVPFYSWDLKSSTIQWQYREEISYPGNEANGTRQDTLYLSCAILVVGKLGKH
ncbi:hypothetical protein DFS33DRAFT_1383312 [Desarmillaria ectypa]|nr:hypothetical protein DFS33DRAFT_1383312 [Desarmillaria ectypa]